MNRVILADDAVLIRDALAGLLRHNGFDVRGLSLEVVAGLAGIGGAPYLSMLERGQRGFNRHGLIEDLADALGCSVADLTGQPYLASDRATVEGRAALPGISLALNDFGPDEVPDVTPRLLDELVAWAERANEHRDQGRFSLAGWNLGTLFTELLRVAGPTSQPPARRLTWPRSTATRDPQRCISIWLGRWCRTERSATRRRSGTWTPPTAWPRPGSATTPSPGTWYAPWTGGPSGRCGSWTACVTASVSQGGVDSLSTTRR